MFKLAQSPTFWAPVEAEVTAEKGGRYTARFEMKFRRLTVDELNVLRERIASEEMKDGDIAREIVVDWRGIEGEDGAPAEFNQDNFAQLLNLGLGVPIAAAFFANIPRAKVKN